MSQRATKHESTEQVGQEASRRQTPRSGEHRLASPESPEREHAVIQQYFDRFAEAMASGDSKAMAKLWGVPAFVIGAHEARVVPSESEVEQFFGGSKDIYTERGIVGTRAEILDLDWVATDLVIATIRWLYIDQNERTLGEESSSYTLLRGEDGGFKLRVVTMRGEVGNASET